ncbi:MAG: hypothetical protein DWI00_15810 [Planctomycetota bacterium]|jgi:hypothetical protein|nr:MAG: hypothetical protein DWI00_15810 [Planctomycetota bacterium]
MNAQSTTKATIRKDEIPFADKIQILQAVASKNPKQKRKQHCRLTQTMLFSRIRSPKKKDSGEQTDHLHMKIASIVRTPRT